MSLPQLMAIVVTGLALFTSTVLVIRATTEHGHEPVRHFTADRCARECQHGCLPPEACH